MAAKAILLSMASREQLAVQARGVTSPKWSSLCLLKLLDLPVLNAAMLPPGSSRRTVASTVDRFSKLLHKDRLQVRSDGGLERRAYFRGGDSYAIDRVLSLATRLTSAGRTVILHEPTDRLANLLTANILMDATGEMIVEVATGGFDAGDINRGGIVPHYQMSYRLSSWACIEAIEPAKLQVVRLRCDEAARLNLRLETIAKKILPSRGVRLPRQTATAAARWLHANGYELLWSSDDVLRDPSAQFKAWYVDAYRVARGYGGIRRWNVLAMSGSDLGDGRFVYWDIVDAQRKFASQGVQA